VTIRQQAVKSETGPVSAVKPKKILSSGAGPVKAGISTEYWDSIATERLPHRVLNPVLDEHKKIIHEQLLARWGEIKPGTRVLKTDLFEEATGPDQLLFNLCAKSGRAVGMDISNQIASRARQKAAASGIGGVECLCCDVRRLPFRSGSFDLIFSGSTLDHFPTEAEIIVSLKELTRILKPGGVFILTIDNKNSLTYPPYSVMRAWMRLGFSPYFIGRTLSLRQFRKLSAEIGLDIVESTAIFHFPHPDILMKKIVRFCRKVSGGRLDGAIMNGLQLLDRLGNTPLKYLTGRYLALKMVKKQEVQGW
jgi:ubiquinone/menaquinone biosynthesis C-methylase UbiE